MNKKEIKASAKRKAANYMFPWTKDYLKFLKRSQVFALHENPLTDTWTKLCTAAYTYMVISLYVWNI